MAVSNVFGGEIIAPGVTPAPATGTGNAEDLTLTAGAAGTGNANGGNVNLVPTVASGLGSPGEVVINGSAAGFEPIVLTYAATSIDNVQFVAARAFRVKAITCRPLVAGSDLGAVSVMVKKAASGTAITAGTALLSASFNLKRAANTNQLGALTATTADLDIAAGVAIGLDFTGTLTAAVGTITVTLVPV
jgi:hypothetical protein